MVPAADLVPHDVRSHRRRIRMHRGLLTVGVLAWVAAALPLSDLSVHLVPDVDDNLVPLVWLLAASAGFAVWSEHLLRSRRRLRREELLHLGWVGAVREHLVVDRDMLLPDAQQLITATPAQRVIGGRDLHQWSGTVERGEQPVRVTVSVDGRGAVEIAEG